MEINAAQFHLPGMTLLKISLLFIVAIGCASPQKARFVTESECAHLADKRATVVIAKVISVDSIGSKHIENYLLGSAPARMKVYSNVILQIDSVMKGDPKSRELRICTFLPTSQNHSRAAGEMLIVGFDGSAHQPRNALLSTASR